MPSRSIQALVTGGAGFVGSHLAEGLCRSGVRVVVLDNLESGSGANLDWPRSGGELEFIRGDLREPAVLRRALAGCDWVFHQAAMPSVPWSVAEPKLSHTQNLEATLELLLAAREAGVKRFLFASSSSIYGGNSDPSKQESLPPDPLSPYALQKYASEKYGQLFHQFYGLPFVALRYFNVFGPRQGADSPYSGVIARFCRSMLGGERPVIYGDGRQSRDFTYVENVVRANLLAAKAPPEKVAGKAFNIACGKSIDLLQLVADLNRLTGQSLEPRFEPARPGDVRSSCGDISAATAGFGYRIEVPWLEGLERTLEWYRTKQRVIAG